MAVASDLDKAHLHYLVVIERVTSGLSVAGCLFVIITFLISKSFRRPINRLIFFASVGNLFTNIATVTAAAVLDNETGFLCQAQGFLIQMFMAADVLWTLAMAFNVYLTFYHKFGVARLKKMEKWYFLLCYGLPFIPAFAYIWAQSPGKGRIYGNALLWCWITPEYDYLRVATFYGPIWLVILVTFGIYIRAGREIYNKRKQLRQFASSEIGPDMIPTNPFNHGAIHEQTDVAISYENTADHPTIDVNALGRQLSAADRRHSGQNGQPQYTVAVSAVPAVYKIGSMPPFPSVSKRPKKTKEEKERGEDPALKRYQTIEANRAAWGYTKVAVLFFSAMLITWIPSSANRLYGVAHPGQISIPLTYAAAFVLPLQGFWNCLIYMITSLNACKELLGWMGVKRYSDGTLRHGGHERRNNTFGMTNLDMGRGTRIPSMAGDKDISETESTVELATQQ
ncbi:hypothetical protein V499_00534 [Pseudogymnoascus sp. VKM F-103]|uniref:G-protein coupled receptors family 2 profile 2 domain-containing protein n=1 Tax=Pseudogymnoascus verrucosus TaxID=342668 RepID=A0A1B8GV95_9PEZI|nr:uncharacterized protein VE01_02007 [Pseudogymnoascus verrucosus]KFY80643.1 hypothetical protein V499_00534 [Pseudogymnoascus sp. VKM F-103]OBT99761.1 hypothetical protein VE01_02007 [Pseudogymnoascus verrucosus]